MPGVPLRRCIVSVPGTTLLATRGALLLVLPPRKMKSAKLSFVLAALLPFFPSSVAHPLAKPEPLPVALASPEAFPDPDAFPEPIPEPVSSAEEGGLESRAPMARIRAQSRR